MESSHQDCCQCHEVVVGIPLVVAPHVHYIGHLYILNISQEYFEKFMNNNISLIIGWKIWVILGA